MQIVEAYFYLFHHSLQIIGPGDDAVPASPKKKNEKDSLKRFVITIFFIYPTQRCGAGAANFRVEPEPIFFGRNRLF